MSSSMWKVAPVLSWPGAGWSAPTGAVPVPGCQCTGTNQPVLGSVEGDPRGMWVGLMVLTLCLTQPKDCSLPCSGLKGWAWARHAQSRARMAPLDQLCTCRDCGFGPETPKGVCRRGRPANSTGWFESRLQAEAAPRTWH